MKIIEPRERVYNDQGEEIGLDLNQNPHKWVKLSEWERDHPGCHLYLDERVILVPDHVEFTALIFHKKDVEA